MKLILLPIIFLLTIGWSTALLCTDYQQVNQTCMMVTPSLNCSNYTYSIYFNQSSIENGSLTNYYSDVYYFNFTESIGQYIIEICDGSTRQITVGANGDNNMALGALILIPLIFAIILLYWVNNLSEEHNILKLLIGLMPIPLLWISLQFATQVVINLYGLTELVNNMSFVLRISGYIFFTLVIYFILYILIKSIDNLVKKRQEKMVY